jgi:hypothetical protein
MRPHRTPFAGAIVMTVLTVVLDNHGAHAPPLSAPVFAALAFAVAVVSFVLPARAAVLTAKRNEVELAPGRPAPGSSQPTVTFANPARAAKRAFGAAFAPFVLSVALSEAVCLFGFALHMVGGRVAASLPIALFGVALVAIRFPTVTRMVGAYESAHGAAFDLTGR